MNLNNMSKCLKCAANDDIITLKVGSLEVTELMSACKMKQYFILVGCLLSGVSYACTMAVWLSYKGRGRW